jgi:hypothetical protein
MMKKAVPLSAMRAMGHNREVERRTDQMGDLVETIHASAVRISELTDMVGALQDRVAALEAKG